MFLTKKRLSFRATACTAAVITIIFAIFIAILQGMGRIPWCTCGFGLWTSSAWSKATSQYFADPYSFSHVLHGMIFFPALLLVAKTISLRGRLIIALLLEIGWEMLENSPLIINRYRAATASLDYFGDSILNSTGDVLCMLLGFWLAYRLPWKWTLSLGIVIELVMLLLFRDNLTLNVLMLLHPVEAVKLWQIAR